MTATMDDLYNQLVGLNQNILNLIKKPGPTASSWQFEYLKKGWGYQHVNSIGNGGSISSGQNYSMGTQQTIIANQVVNGLLHFFAVGFVGSIDCRNAQVYISDAGPGQSTAIANFAMHDLNDLGLNGWLNAFISSTIQSDTEKVYTAILSPAYPIPVHNLTVRITLPTPTLDPAIKVCQIAWDGLFSSPLNFQSAAGYINKNATTSIEASRGEYIQGNFIE